jgi:GT2 family glycosyltransferase
MAVSADFYRRLGGLDTAFERGDFEDADLCLRARRLGAEVLLHPASGLYHLERQSYTHMAGSKFREVVTYLNCLEFNRRWAGQISGVVRVQKRARPPQRGEDRGSEPAETEAREASRA